MTREERQQEAIAAAERLLMDVCDEQQREDYKEHGYFKVAAKSGSVYTLNARTGSIRSDIGAFCFTFAYPFETMLERDYAQNDLKMFNIDKAIATKLVIEWDEARFRFAANKAGRILV